MIKDREKAEEELTICLFCGREQIRPSTPDEEYVQEEQCVNEEYIDMLAILEELFEFCI